MLPRYLVPVKEIIARAKDAVAGVYPAYARSRNTMRDGIAAGRVMPDEGHFSRSPVDAVTLQAHWSQTRNRPVKILRRFAASRSLSLSTRDPSCTRAWEPDTCRPCQKRQAAANPRSTCRCRARIHADDSASDRTLFPGRCGPPCAPLR